MTPRSSHTTSISRGLTVALALTSLTLAARPAHAQEGMNWNGVGQMNFDSGTAAMLGVTDAIALAPTVVDTVYAMKGKRPALIWPVLGYVFGTIQTFFGVAGLANNNDAVRYGAALPTVILGTYNLTIASVSLAFPRERAKPHAEILQRVALSPWFGKDAGGQPARGVTLGIGF